MNFSRAFSYVFDDRDWLAKLLITFAVTAGAVLLSVVLVGFALWAALLGYFAEVQRNVRLGVPQPLPRWDNFGEKMSRGVPILIAYIVYNLPNVIIGVCLGFAAPSMGGAITGTALTAMVACCLFPLLLIYNVIIWPMLAVATARYTDEGRTNVFYEFGSLFAVIQQQSDATIQFVLFSALAWLLFTLIGWIPCIGWVGVPALIVPVTGALSGQYVARVLGKPRAPRNVPVAPRRRR